MGELPVVGFIEFVLGDLLREWNGLDDASRHLRNGIAILHQVQKPFLALDGYISLARLKAIQKDYDGALETLADIGSQVGTHHRPEWLKNRLASWKNRIELMRGNLEAAVHWAETIGFDESENLRYSDEPEHLTVVRVLIAQARDDPRKPYAEQALYRLRRLLSFADAQERTGSVIEILALQALALEAQGEISEALISLNRALSLAMPGGYLRLFLDEGEKMNWLISGCRSKIEKDIQKSGIEKWQPVLVYIDRLLSGYNKTKSYPQPQIIDQQSKISNLVEPLSEREIDVIRLVASGLSTDQIADKLFISVGTVRNHLKSIYGKLNAHSRVQAVEHAREVHLL